jgi:pimeloyl-ACP methyl ester carboxylesterase
MRSGSWALLSSLLLFCLFANACSPVVPNTKTTNTQPTGTANPSAIQNVESSFKEEDCDFEGNEYIRGTIRCGILTVPEERGDPASPTLQLHVGIFKSTAKEPQPDPLFITFGPYNMGFMYFLGFTRLFGGYLDQRDIIVLEPRGSGRSGMSLECPELETAFLDTLELEFNSRGVQDLMVEAHQTCRQRGETMIASIQNLNIIEMAADFEDLRQSLGYEKVNVQALGTGTRIAEIWAAQHPDSIRTLTMVSPIPLADNIFLDQVKSTDRAIQTVFQECAADKNCAKAYPNLDKVFTQLIADLNTHPLNVEVNYLAEGTHYTMRLNGDRFIDLAYVIATSTESDWIGYLPQIIYETKDSNTASSAEALAHYIDYTRPSGTPFAQGIWCDEILRRDAKEAIQAEIDRSPAVYSSYFKNALAINTATCTVWGERVNRPASSASTLSTIPALFLTSSSDLVSPADISAQATKNYTPAFIYDFSGGGGTTALPWWDCWSKVQTAFMLDPTIPPQESCVQKKPTISWITFKP